MAITQSVTGRNIEAEYSNIKDTFPASIAPTSGSVSTGYRKDQIIGTSTVFKTDIEKGDYMWFTTTDELVEVIGVIDDTHLTLGKEVSGVLSGVAFKVVKKNGFKTISWYIDTVGSANINTISYEAGVSRTYGNNKPNGQGGGNRLSPVLIDSTVNANIVSIVAE